jgi:hypothetical protein
MEPVFGMAWDFNGYQPSSPESYAKLLNETNSILKISRLDDNEELVDLVLTPLKTVPMALPVGLKRDGDPDWFMFPRGEDLLRLVIFVPAWVRIIWKRTPR